MYQDGTERGRASRSPSWLHPGCSPCFGASPCQDDDSSPDEYLDLGQEVDADPLGLQAACLFAPHTKVLHVRQDDVLHGSAGSDTQAQNNRFQYHLAYNPFFT